ncbi:RNA polymerase recycling motor HelD [Peribacillus deserti]|uniref:DNA helicase n=1 Tax=Peribacillus deserti TaxID=673318 RepID=A0A2N5LZQ4_9BACI|nr:RNA polymerase recycling motor HelD [Peribacillus deserti]PLT27590.1 DNA helicase [Peribacillus deserti]
MEQHPDFIKESQRLDFTKRYMDVVIETAESSKDQFKKNMERVFGDEDWLETGGYAEILTNASFFEMSMAELESLRRAKDKPYFARVDFSREGQEKKEVLYFGKTSLYQRENQEQIIVDWRSPIANLYYEGRVGEVSYEAEGEEFQGNISLKRQLMIEEGILTDVRDIDLTTTDELLQDSLSKSSSNRLTEIVATIQEEQNRIIRADLNKPIIVQGAAGSGKTTIALHRISYFIYHYRDQFDPRQMMIIAPSRLFIDYISEALPELGVEKVKQFTFSEYVQQAIGKKLKLKEDNKLIRLLEQGSEEADVEAFISGIKGSEIYKNIMDAYLKDVYMRFNPKEDFYVDKYRLYSAKKFKTLFNKEYWYLPLFSRLDKLKNILQNQVRANKKLMVEGVEKYYDDRLDRALFSRLDPEKRKELVTNALDKKQERVGEVQTAIKVSLRNYMKQFEKKPTLRYYQELFEDEEQFMKYADGKLQKNEAQLICRYNQSLFSKKMYELEDLGPILYLHSKLYGVDKENRAKNIVIDEAQDYSFMQLLSLKTASDTDMFTLVGDLAQGIHSYRGLDSWETIQKKVFPRAIYSELQKSYRTTVEIMNEANKLLEFLPYEFPKVEPVVRHGESPEFTALLKDEDYCEQVLLKLDELKQENLKTFAIICKTMKDSQKLYQLLKDNEKHPVKLLQEQESIPKDQTVILPSYLSKGLEFDAVLAVSLEEAYSKDNELDIKLLYVTMTRPLHRLYFFGKKREDFLIG